MNYIEARQALFDHFAKTRGLTLLSSEMDEIERLVKQILDATDDTMLILSLKHSPVNGNAVWWGPEFRGYTTDIKKAGRYSKEMVRQQENYINNNITTQAIPIESLDMNLAEVTVSFWTAKQLTQNETK